MVVVLSFTLAGLGCLADLLGGGGSVVQSLDLSCNTIEDDGAGLLAAALQQQQQHVGLQALVLTGNRITDRGALVLVEACLAHPFMRSLTLNGNRLTETGQQLIRQRLTSSAPPASHPASPPRRQLEVSVKELPPPARPSWMDSLQQQQAASTAAASTSSASQHRSSAVPPHQQPRREQQGAGGSRPDSAGDGRAARTLVGEWDGEGGGGMATMLLGATT